MATVKNIVKKLNYSYGCELYAPGSVLIIKKRLNYPILLT